MSVKLKNSLLWNIMPIMDKDIAISVNNVSKTFRIPHEKISSLRGAFVSMFLVMYT